MATAVAEAKPTKAETIARQLADDILSGRLPPGSALDETLIAARYGVSRTPIREAIRQLSASGMIESRRHRGAVVPMLPEQQLDDMFAVMADLEALCARASAASMTGAEHTRLRHLVEQSRPLVDAGDHDGYSALNDAFHEAIYAGSHNGYLARLTVETRTKLAPYRRAQFVTAGRLAASHAEHGRIVEAITARDPAAAFDAMRAHIVVVRTAVDRISPGAAEAVHRF